MSERAFKLWEVLSQLFGAEALAKKYGEEPPPLWREMAEALPDYQFERGVRRLVTSGAKHLPTLPEFRELCTDLEHHPGDYIERDLDAPRLPARQWNKWEIEANMHLLAYVRRKPKYVHPDATPSLDGSPVKPGPEGTRRTKRLVAAKNAWAEDMQAAEKNGAVPIEEQLAAWKDVISSAEADIDAGRLA